MAEIHVEKKPRSGWIWLLVLLLVLIVAALAWYFWPGITQRTTTTTTTTSATSMSDRIVADGSLYDAGSATAARAPSAGRNFGGEDA